MMNIFDGGTPKYSTAQDIYDALCVMASGEEIGIIGDIFQDVSWEGQDYYYTDKGYELKERFEKLSDYGFKMWLMELAVWQISDAEVHDLVFDALTNDDVAKRLGFKKLFIDHMLRGDKTRYDELSEAYYNEICELNRFDYWGMATSWIEVCNEYGEPVASNPHASPYRDLCNAIYKKAKNLRLTEEIRCIIECRAALTGYDDFMYGLKMNQALYETQEQQYGAKVARLEANYNEKVHQLYLLAEKVGLTLEGINDQDVLPEVIKI